MIGETIGEVWVASCEETLFFKTETGWVSWDGEADCCSETWFSDVIGLRSLIGQKVRQVIELNLPGDGQERSRQEVDQVFGRAIVTDRGTCTVVCRNSSNGYYGGYIQDGTSEPRDGSKRIEKDDWSS